MLNNRQAFEDAVGQGDFMYDPELYSRVYAMIELRQAGEHEPARRVGVALSKEFPDLKFPTLHHDRWAVDKGHIFWQSMPGLSILILPRKGEVMPLVGVLCLHNCGNEGVPTPAGAHSLVQGRLKINSADLKVLFQKRPAVAQALKNPTTRTRTSILDKKSRVVYTPTTR